MINIRSILLPLMLCFTLGCSSAMAQNQVTITDTFAPHSPYLRWEQFSTDLSASVANPPQSTTETTITGPTYVWSCGSPSPGFTIVGSGNSGSATLDSATPSISVSLTAGPYSVTVYCTVTYTSTNNASGVATPIPYSGSTNVIFFVRAPELVEETGPRQLTSFPNAQVPDQWGNISVYPFELLDNQTPSAQSYGNGLLHENFSGENPSTWSPNGPGGPAYWSLTEDIHGNGDGTGSPTDTWTDNNGVLFTVDPVPFNENIFEGSFNQNWTCLEATPPYSSPQYYTEPFADGTVPVLLQGINTTFLSPTMHVASYYGYAIRSFPGDPYPD